MEQRTLGRTGLQVSAISMGTEYLIDRPLEDVIPVIHEAIARGVNYFDLFWAQPEFRDNMGAAFAGKRQQVLLAAHLGATWREGQGDKSRDLALCEAFFEDFLNRYHTDYVDILYLHNIDEQADYDGVMRPGSVADLARRLQREGKARFIGFSGHTVSTSLQAVASGQVDVLMFPINLASNAIPGKRELFAACAARNVGLVAMKPFAGGKLLTQEQRLSMMFFQTGGGDLELQRAATVTPLQCLSYVLAQVGLSTIVPGVKNLAELAAAQAYWQATAEERDYSGALSAFQQYKEGECVYCNHCLPCPSGIDIGQTIRLFELAEHDLTAELAAAYALLPAKASDCVQCGACVERCPFGVDGTDKMEQAAALFERPASR